MAKTIRTKILEVLAATSEPVDIQAVAEGTESEVKSITEALSRLNKEALVENTDKGFWQINDKGREELNKIGEQEARSKKQAAISKELKQEPREVPETVPPAIGETIVPTQADNLREIGKRLAIGTGAKDKDAVKLDAIIYYVQHAANLDDLTSVWNALTEMRVANDVKKTWLKLYSQTLPNKQIPDELKEKLESGQETEKVTTEEKGGIPPKAKRFILVGNEIIGDPEGDLTFNQALQQRAQNLGAAPAEANTAATIIEALKVGPEMSTSLLTVLLPLLTKEPPKHDDSAMLQFITAQQTASQSQMQLLQQMLMTATEEKHKAELEGIKTMIAAGQKPPESNQQLQTLTEQINSLREALHQQQITTVQEQNKTMIERLENQIARLEQQIIATAQGKSVDSKIGLLDKTLDKGAQELSGVRQDIKGFAQMMMAKGEPPPKPRSPQEKQRFAKGLTEGIERSDEAKRQARELWGTP